MKRTNGYSVSVLSCGREVDVAWFETYTEAAEFAKTINGRVNVLSRKTL